MLGYIRRTLPLVARASLHRDGRLISRIDKRVPLRQIDFNWHMNQAAYAQVMELGRADWVLRSLAWTRWREAELKPVVAEQRIVYRRELELGARYTIDTRALAMDGRLLVLRSLILVGDQVHASNEAKLIFVGDQGVLSAEDSADACAGLTTEALEVVDWRVVSQHRAPVDSPARGR